MLLTGEGSFVHFWAALLSSVLHCGRRYHCVVSRTSFLWGGEFTESDTIVPSVLRSRLMAEVSNVFVVIAVVFVR